MLEHGHAPHIRLFAFVVVSCPTAIDHAKVLLQAMLVHFVCKYCLCHGAAADVAETAEQYV